MSEVNEDLVQQLKANARSFAAAGLTEDAEAAKAKIVELGGELDEEVEAETETEGYESWTNEELQAELESRGLTKSGNKAELIERLEEDDG